MRLYTFSNRGTLTTFNPKKVVMAPSGDRTTALAFYEDMVRDAERRDVYITDHKGREVIPSTLEVAA